MSHLKNEENTKRGVLFDIIEWSMHSNCFERIGNCAFLKLNNGNNIKVMCGKDRFYCYTINRTMGEVDRTELPFDQYFAPVRCSENSPWWFPHLDGCDWYFHQYPHCLPKDADFEALAEAVDDYISLFS